MAKLYNYRNLCKQLTSELDAVYFLQKFKIIPQKQLCMNNHEMQVKFLDNRPVWYCSIFPCKTIKLSVRKGNWLEHSKLKLCDIILFIFLWSWELTSIDFCKNEFGFSNHTTIDYNNYLREVCAFSLLSEDTSIGGEGLTVEVDETYFSKRKNHQGRVLPEQWVFGGICHETKEVFLLAVPDRTEKTLIDAIKNKIKPGTIIISDCWASYKNISTIRGFNYKHLTVNQSRNFVDPITKANIQNIESIWNSLKRKSKKISGTNCSMIDSYLYEFLWRQKHSKEIAFDSILHTIAKFNLAESSSTVNEIFDISFVTVKEEAAADIKDSYVMNDIENPQIQSAKQNSLNEIESPDIVKEEFDFSSATVKNEPDDVDVKEDPLESCVMNDIEKTHTQSRFQIAQNRKKRTALILKLAAKSERRWQGIAPDALPPTRVNLKRSTEDVVEASKTDIQLETENHVSPPTGCEVTASTNADLTIDPVEVPIGLMDVKACVSKLPDPLLPTLFMDTESTIKNVPKTSRTDLSELQALSNDEWVECEPIQEETEKHISPSTECEVTAPTMTDLTAGDPVEVSIEQMAREARKSGLTDDIVTGQLLGTESTSVNNNINTDSTDEEDQDPFHNSDDEEVDPDYNTLNSGSKSGSENRDEPATGIKIENANEPITRKRKRGKFNKRTLAKKMRNCGEEYESKTRGIVNKRSMKPPCHNCKLKCTEKIDENYRKENFAMFWGMGDLQRQREFIKDSTQAVVPKYQRMTLNRKRERGSNQSYSITKDGEKIRVCKLFFKNTFDLSDRAIRTTFEKTDRSTGVLSLELRGKHGKNRKLDKELVKSAKVHIKNSQNS